MNRQKYLLVLAALLLAASGAWAYGPGLDFDVSAGGNFLQGYNGSGTNMNIRLCAGGDLNGDGIDDIVSIEPSSSTFGRSSNGVVYVTYGLFKSTGGIVNNIPAVANVRINGANSNDALGNCWVGDYNGDGQDDIMVRADGSDTLYIIYGPLPNGVGNSIDLANPAQYGVKIVMPGGWGNMFPFLADLNGDGIDDLFIEVPQAGNNGSNSGSLYISYGPQPTGPGFTKDLSVTTNWNLRIDGDGTSAYLTGNKRNGTTGPYDSASSYWSNPGIPTTAVGDINGDGAPDIMVGGLYDSNWGRSQNGVVYVSTGPFPITTGNVWNTGVPGRFMLHIGGESGNAAMSRAMVGDINGDGYNDLCVTEVDGNVLGRGNSGGLYCFFGPLNYPMDTVLDMNIADDFNVVFYDDANGNAAYDGAVAVDMNGDGYKDLVFWSPWTDIGSYSDEGAVYVVNGGPITGGLLNYTQATTGIYYDLTNASSYNLRVSQDGYYSEHVGEIPPLFKDVDGDGILDLIVTSEGWNTNNVCSSNVGQLAVLYGPSPNTTGNQVDINPTYDMRYHYSSCNISWGFPTISGDYDGDGYQDVAFSLPWQSFSGGSGNGRWWAVSLSTGTARITQPILFTSSGTSNNLSITWASVAGASQYEMQLDVDPRFPAPVSDQSVSATNATVTGLTNGQSYYVHVRAKNGNFTRYGPIATFTVDATAPTAPTLLAPPNGGSVGTQTPTFNWTDASPE